MAFSNYMTVSGTTTAIFFPSTTNGFLEYYSELWSCHLKGYFKPRVSIDTPENQSGVRNYPPKLVDYTLCVQSEHWAAWNPCPQHVQGLWLSRHWSRFGITCVVQGKCSVSIGTVGQEHHAHTDIHFQSYCLSLSSVVNFSQNNILSSPEPMRPGKGAQLLG